MGGVSASMGMASLGYRSNAYAGRVGFGQPIRRALHTMMGHSPTAAQMSMGGMGYGMGTTVSYSMPSSMAMGYGGMGAGYASIPRQVTYSAGAMPSYSVASSQVVYELSPADAAMAGKRYFTKLPISFVVKVGVNPAGEDLWSHRSYDGTSWFTDTTKWVRTYNNQLMPYRGQVLSVTASTSPAPASDPFNEWNKAPMSGDNKPVTQADLRALEDRITARQDRTDAMLRNLVPAQLPPDVTEKMKGIEEQLKRLIPAPQKSQESLNPMPSTGTGNGRTVRHDLAVAGKVMVNFSECQQVQVPPAPPPSPVDALAARVSALKKSVDALAPLYSRVAELEGQAKTLIDLSSQLDAIQLRLNQLSRPQLKGTVLPPPEIKEKQSGPASEVVRVRYQDSLSPVYVTTKKE